MPDQIREEDIEIITRGLKQLETSTSELFIFVSPLRNKTTHTLENSGCRILIKDAIQIPTTRVLIDSGKAKRLSKILSAKSTQSEDTFLYDLEFYLHSLMRICPQGRIIPIMIGSSEIDKAIRLGSFVANEFRAQNPVIIALGNLDDESLSTAEFCDRQRFSLFAKKRISSESKMEIAYAPVIAALEYANQQKAHNFTTIASKADQTSSAGTPVILAAAMLWDYHPPHITLEQKNELFKIGFDAIETYLKGGYIPNYTTNDPVLNRKSGVFITLREKSFLRGCIGRMNADEHLYKAVQKISIAAATSDPRFSPMTIEDLNKITLKISILSPLQKIDIDDIEIGKHGLMISHKGHRGVLLPEVPVERNWDLDTFLAHLCMKAGLHPSNLEENPAIYAFTSIELSKTSR